jgi:hypothetical protein
MKQNQNQYRVKHVWTIVTVHFYDWRRKKYIATWNEPFELNAESTYYGQ